MWHMAIFSFCVGFVVLLDLCSFGTSWEIESTVRKMELKIAPLLLGKLIGDYDFVSKAKWAC